jgi:uncharacterized glyoxalase superfamily protein PhnB
MLEPSQVLLYVEDPAKSSGFYADLLKKQPVLTSPHFALFDLGGFKLGLWARNKVEPRPSAVGESGELCIIVADQAALQAVHRQWVEKGIPIALAPMKMYFGGYTFVGLDPDGHRLRVNTPD